MKFRFSLSQTAAARRIFRISAPLKKEMQLAAKTVIQAEIKDIRDVQLSIIAMSDEELLELNKSALGHDWYTDIITFEIERTKTALEGEIYLSVERALANAKRFRQAGDLELLHLVIHGVLHIAGYSDKSPKAKKQMRKIERLYLVRYRLD